MGRAGRDKFQKEFAAAASARLLGGLFADAANVGARKPVGSVDAGAPNLLCLFDRWPLTNHAEEPSLDGPTLLETRRSLPNSDWLALKPGDLPHAAGSQSAAPSSEWLHACDFLPDAVVFETYWRNFLPQAYRLEGWRGDVGGGYEADEFLSVCRVALYLQHAVLARQGAEWHLHAVGRLSLLCAWLLPALGGGGQRQFSPDADDGRGSEPDGIDPAQAGPRVYGGMDRRRAEAGGFAGRRLRWREVRRANVAAQGWRVGPGAREARGERGGCAANYTNAARPWPATSRTGSAVLKTAVDTRQPALRCPTTRAFSSRPEAPSSLPPTPVFLHPARFHPPFPPS